MSTLNPTQFGYTVTGINGVAGISSVTIGRSVSGSFEGTSAGGQGGRPDYLQVMQINLANRVGSTITPKGTITMNVSDLVSIVGLPSNLNLTLKEVTVCELGVTKKMVILGSQTYT